MTAIQNYLAPTTLDDALAALAGGNCTVLAGGTDLMPQSRAGRISFAPMLLNIRRLEGALRSIEQKDGTIRIGALTTITDLHESALVRERLTVLWQAADQFASGQIRNMGTVGGNICNASPAGDTLVPLIVLDAEVELASTAGTRRLPLSGFFTGPGRSHREATELLTAIVLPAPADGFRARFAKFGTRPALDISAVSVAVGGVVKDGVLTGARAAFGAAAPTPLRGRRTEAALEGRSLDATAIEAAAAAARDEVSPIDDVRASGWYRREMIHNLTRKVLSDVAAA